MDPVINALKQSIKGAVFSDRITRNIYSVDASIYEVEPLGVVVPENLYDLQKTLEIAAEYNTPVTARGAATGITGGCLSKGLIIDMSRTFNRIIEINIEEEYAIVEPGVVQDRLNEALSPYGYRLGPDTSTGNSATIGGMLANNSAGARSLRYGRMVDHVIETDLLLAGGHQLRCRPLDESQLALLKQSPTLEGKVYRETLAIVEAHRKAIDLHFPKIPRHVSGYNLDLLLNRRPFNLCNLIAGSEGTLGITSLIKVRIAKKPIQTALCILFLDEMVPALNRVGTMMDHSPLSLEMIDEKILNAAKASPTVKQKLEWLQGSPQAVIVAEFDGTTHQEAVAKAQAFADDMKSHNIGDGHTVLSDPKTMGYVWDVRKAGLGLLLSKRDYTRAIAFIEDLSVPPHSLGAFIDAFKSYLKSVGKEAGIYGHVGSGCMHIRPYIDLRNPKEVTLMASIMEEVSSMVLAHGGALSGEHGDGLIRSWLNPKMFGDEVYMAFKEIKQVFDPAHLMNPGKIVDGPPLTQDLRLSPNTPEIGIDTFLDFSREGGLALAADLCNGNGQCRKMESIMCPSFQASGNEYDSTRARAQTLRGIIHGKLPKEEFTSKGLYDVLDLCIECKGCKRECPSQVDMAKMKSEFLYQYQQKNGYSVRARLFAHIHKLNTVASRLPNLYNLLTASKVGKWIAARLGISPHRLLPRLASERFSSFFKRNKQLRNGKRVALFNDTFTEFHEPHIGTAACRILEALGYEVDLIEGYCCGRPLISKGFLQQAKAVANTLVDALTSSLAQEMALIVLEPGCLSALRDDYSGLLGQNDKRMEKVCSHAISFDEFLKQHIRDGKLPLPFKEMPSDIYVHGHCHQKALVGMGPTIDVLRAIPGATVHEIDSGCCGMAGSFGYESEHYSFSMRIGELRLFPTIRNSPDNALIVASGASCRAQISQGTLRKALHLAEALAILMNPPTN